MALGLVLTGHFSNLLVFTLLIIVHELGHVFSSLIFGYKISKIIIYPFGGLTKLNTMINTNIYEDLVVAISGTLMQCVFFVIIYIMYKNGLIREYIFNLFYLYHKSMFLFNLLPIIPLDGFKILNLILSKIFNFNLSNNLSVFISLFFVTIFLFSGMYDKNYSIVLIIGIFMKNIYTFYNQIGYIYNRFLLERYLYSFNYKKKKVISDGSKMYKDKSHLIVKNGRILTEKGFLFDFFQKKY